MTSLVVTPLVAIILPKQVLEFSIFSYLPLRDALHILLFISGLCVVLLSGAAGVIWSSIQFREHYFGADHQFFYDKDRGFLMRSTYTVRAGWGSELKRLPQEDFIWLFDIEKHKIFYRIIARGRLSDRKIQKERPTIEVRDIKSSPSVNGDGVRVVSWCPELDPPLRPRETITYQVEIYTPNSEGAAFTENGSIFGIGTRLPTKSMNVTAYAPLGYSFDLIGPISTVRRYGTGEQLMSNASGKSTPKLSPDGTVVSLFKKWPRKNQSYWVHFRFKEHD